MNLSSRIHSTGVGHFCLYVATCLSCVCVIACRGPGEVLLYYCYCQIKEPRFICDWQKELCSKLRLTGKVNSVLFFYFRYCCGLSFTALHFVLVQVRVATEGINGTVGGTKTATSVYIKAMLAHPIFQVMQVKDFKVNEQKSTLFHGAVHFYTK